jgi:hypothetical protein
MTKELSSTNVTDIPSIIEGMPKKIPWLEINRRYVLAVETMAHDSGVSTARFCREVGIPDKSVAHRKSGRLGKRGIPFTELQALDKIGVDRKLFEDPRIDNIKNYLPREPVKISKKKLRESRRDQEMISLIADVTEIKDKLNTLFQHLNISAKDSEIISDPTSKR